MELSFEKHKAFRGDLQLGNLFNSLATLKSKKA